MSSVMDVFSLLVVVGIFKNVERDEVVDEYSIVVFAMFGSDSVVIINAVAK